MGKQPGRVGEVALRGQNDIHLEMLNPDACTTEAAFEFAGMHRPVIGVAGLARSEGPDYSLGITRSGSRLWVPGRLR